MMFSHHTWAWAGEESVHGAERLIALMLAFQIATALFWDSAVATLWQIFNKPQQSAVVKFRI